MNTKRMAMAIVVVILTINMAKGNLELVSGEESVLKRYC